MGTIGPLVRARMTIGLGRREIRLVGGARFSPFGFSWQAAQRASKVALPGWARTVWPAAIAASREPYCTVWAAAHDAAAAAAATRPRINARFTTMAFRPPTMACWYTSMASKWGERPCDFRSLPGWSDYGRRWPREA